MIGLGVGPPEIAVRHHGAAEVELPPAPAFAMAQLDQPHRIYQRAGRTGGAPGRGTGSITLSVTPSAPVALFEYRRRSVADGSIRQGWTRCGSNVAAGSQMLTLPGVEAQAGWDHIDLRANRDDAAIALGTTPVAVGRLICGWGQSLMVALIRKVTDTTSLATLGMTAPDNGRVFHAATMEAPSSVPTAWVQPADGTDVDSAGACELLRLEIAAAGVNVGLIGVSVGGTAMAQWQPGQPMQADLMTAIADAGGAFEAFIGLQGHADMANAVLPAEYRALYDSFFAPIVAANGFPDFDRYFYAIPNLSYSGWGTPYSREGIRRALSEWCHANDAVHVEMTDLALNPGEGIHPTQQGAVRMARHWHRAMRLALGLAHDDAGPLIASAAHPPGRDIALGVALPAGATGLVSVGSPATRLRVHRRGDRASPLPLDGTAPLMIGSPSGGIVPVTLTLASDPGQVALEILPWPLIDPVEDGSADMILDDHVDDDGIAHGRQLGGTGHPVTIRPANPLTISGGSFGAGRFGATLIGGRADSAYPALPGLVTGLTIECWLRVNSPPGAVQVALSQTNAFFIGINGNDLSFSFGPATIVTVPGVLTTGAWHHVAIQLGPYGHKARCFVDGTEQAVTGDGIDLAAGFDAVGSAMGVRTFTGSGGFPLDNGDVDEIAIFEGERYGAGFVPPAAPYTGSEAGLVHLWHLDGDGTDSAPAA